MLIQVPPERGPRSGVTCEKVGVCQRETQQVHSSGGVISVKEQPKETTGNIPLSQAFCVTVCTTMT